jgi:hypothetical protein
MEDASEHDAPVHQTGTARGGGSDRNLLVEALVGTCGVIPCGNVVNSQVPILREESTYEELEISIQMHHPDPTGDVVLGPIQIKHT